jgi:hypothetical protein
MVNFKVPNHDSKVDPLGVQVRYSARGQPRSAVTNVAVREGGKTTTIAIEFEIEESTARLREFRDPTPVTRKHFRGLPTATRQLRRIHGVDRVERPEKTIGDAIIEGHESTNIEGNDLA